MIKVQLRYVHGKTLRMKHVICGFTVGMIIKRGKMFEMKNVSLCNSSIKEKLLKKR